MSIISKTEQAITLWKAGKIKEALRIFKTFKIGFTSKDKEILEVAYEMMAGKESFYVSLGFNKIEIENKAKELIQNTYSL